MILFKVSMAIADIECIYANKLKIFKMADEISRYISAIRELTQWPLGNANVTLNLLQLKHISRINFLRIY